MKKILLVMLLFIAACSSGMNDSDNTGVKNVDAATFSEIISDNDVFVLDVHIPEQQHIKGTDAVIPYNALAENEGSLPADKSTPIAIYCRSGSMSAEASVELAEMGYTNVYNLLGGANAWRSAGYDFEV